MHSHIRTRTLVLLLAGLLFACILTTAATITLFPRQFTTRTDAIGSVLEQRKISYTRIIINRTWPDTVNSQRYAANLLIEMPGSTRNLIGRIECQEAERSCYITVAALGIDREPIPDLAKRQRWPLLEWLERQSGLRFP